MPIENIAAPLQLRIARLDPVWSEPVWVRGSVPPLAGERPVIAVVGARAASGRALRCARELAAELGARGAIIVSGGALGVDGAAHRGALEAGGQTIVVLGSGVDIAYPSRHRDLFEAVVAGGGALLSPFPLGATPLAWHFPARNRLIAALADGVVVVEAQPRSGALGTAREAQVLSRCVMAVPGSPGTDALIAASAFAVEQADEVLAALEGRRRERKPPPTELAPVLDALAGTQAITVAEVAERVGLPDVAIHSALLRLSLLGYVARLPGERYKRLEMDL